MNETKVYPISKKAFEEFERRAKELSDVLRHGREIMTDEEYDQFGYALEKMIEILDDVDLDLVKQYEPKMEKRGVVA